MPSRFSNAGNSRQAFSGGLSPQPAGKRTAGDPFVNEFISIDVPQMWLAQIAVFGRTADYWPGNDPAQAVSITLVWKEGVEDETVSPGRYSHCTIQNSDLPVNPKLGDAIFHNGIEYDVVRVNALITNYSNVVLQDRSEDF